jgi:uncharacterized membrane protein YedE/YeeE
MSDYFLAMAGGLLISLATAFNLFIKGRITGLSGILFSVLSLDRESINWKLPFVLSFIFFGAFARFLMSFDGQNQLFVAPVQMVAGLSCIGFLLGGLFVGLGTKLANGCTSGHGVCGLPRFAIRSWIAVPTFLITAIITANVRKLLNLFSENNQTGDIYLSNAIFASEYSHWMIMGVVLAVLIFFTLHKIQKKNHHAIENIAIGVFIGMIFSTGLILSGMINRYKIINFLVFDENWDPSMLVVLMTAVGLNLGLFNYILSMDKPILAKGWEFTPSSHIDWRLVTGSIFFGIGWGITGICPGPSILLLQFGTIKITGFYFAGLVVGQFSAYYGEKKLSHYLWSLTHKGNSKANEDKKNIDSKVNQKNITERTNSHKLK